MSGLKGCETGQDHVSHSLISALRFPAKFALLGGGGELSLGQLSSSQELKGQEGNPRSGCDGDGDRKESGEGFFLVS